MDTHPERIPPCGMYCGVCRIHQATQEDDRPYLQQLVKVYRRRSPELAAATADDLLCDGCQAARRSLTCRECAIRKCAQEKDFQGCHECAEFPCALIDEFPVPVGRKVMLRAVPRWREHGTEQWVQAAEARYRCPACGQKLFRGARQCPECKSSVDLD